MTKVTGEIIASQINSPLSAIEQKTEDPFMDKKAKALELQNLDNTQESSLLTASSVFEHPVNENVNPLSQEVHFRSPVWMSRKTEGNLAIKSRKLKVPEGISRSKTILGRALLVSAFMLSASAARSTAVPIAKGATYEAPALGAVPDAFNLINTAQQLISSNAQLEEGEKIDLSSPKDVVDDLQSSYLWEKIARVTVKQRVGSKSMQVTLRQEDLLAQASLGTTYTIEKIPGAPGVDDIEFKKVNRFFHFLISPDIVNKFSVRLRAGTMSSNGRCTYLGKSVLAPAFDRYDMVPISPGEEIKPGDKMLVNGQTFKAPAVTDALIAPHLSNIRIKSRKPFSTKKGQHSCLVIKQSWQARQSSYYKFSKNATGAATFIYGPFTKAKQYKTQPKSGKIQP